MTLDYGFTKSARSNVLVAAGLLIERIPTGLLFIHAGWMKIARMGISAFVNQASGTIPPWLPSPLGRSYLYALPWVELLTGILLVLGLFGRIAATIMSLVLISITIAVTGIIEPGKSISPNIIMLSITLGLVLMGPGPWSLDSLIFKNRRNRG